MILPHKQRYKQGNLIRQQVSRRNPQGRGDVKQAAERHVMLASFIMVDLRLGSADLIGQFGLSQVFVLPRCAQGQANPGGNPDIFLFGHENIPSSLKCYLFLQTFNLIGLPFCFTNQILDRAKTAQRSKEQADRNTNSIRDQRPI